MLHLEKVDGKNVWEILKLKVAENQKDFVAENWISIIEAYTVKEANGHAFPFGIYDDRTPVGFLMIGFGVDDDWDNAPVIARGNYSLWRLMIDKKFQGKGYATEAVKLALAWAFRHTGVAAVEAETDPDNIASQKVMLNNGAYVAGEDESHYFLRIPK